MTELSKTLAALMQADSVPMSDAWGKLYDELKRIDEARAKPIGEVVAWGENIPQRQGIDRIVDFRWLNFDVAPGTRLYAEPPVRPVKIDLEWMLDNYQGDVGPGKTVSHAMNPDSLAFTMKRTSCPRCFSPDAVQFTDKNRDHITCKACENGALEVVETEEDTGPGLQVGPAVADGLTTGSFLKADAPYYGLFIDEVGNRAAMAFITESGKGKTWNFREVTYADDRLTTINSVKEWLSELPPGHVIISNRVVNVGFARMLMEQGISIKMVNMGKNPADESEAARYLNNRAKLYSAISPFPLLTIYRPNHIPRTLYPDELYSIGERGKWRIKNLQTMKGEYPSLYMTLEAMALAMGNSIGKQLCNS